MSKNRKTIKLTDTIFGWSVLAPASAITTFSVIAIIASNPPFFAPVALYLTLTMMMASTLVMTGVVKAAGYLGDILWQRASGFMQRARSSNQPATTNNHSAPAATTVPSTQPAAAPRKPWFRTPGFLSAFNTTKAAAPNSITAARVASTTTATAGADVYDPNDTVRWPHLWTSNKSTRQDSPNRTWHDDMRIL